MSPRAILDLLTCLSLFFLVLAPVGYLLLRAGGRPPRQEDLGLALALGYAVVPALVLLELALGGPWLVVPALLVAVWLLRREWPALLRPRRLLALLWLPLLLGALAAWVNAGDVRFGPEGIAFRAGFDVSDRAFYAMVAREVQRELPPATENPLFAGVPFPYSYFPSLLGLLFERLGGVPLLPVFLLHLPVVGLVFVGLATDALLRETGVATRAARVVSVLLVALGGDLSWLLEARNLTALERTRHFYTFHSASAEWLYFNTWMFGAPLALTLLAFASRFLRERRQADLVFAALLAGALFETKLFALVPLLAGALLGSALLRLAPLGRLALAMLAGALPWAWLTSRFGPSREGAPLVLAPLAHVRRLLWAAPGLDGLAGLASSPDSLLASAGLATATVVFLAGGLGARLCGLPRLVSLWRAEPRGFHAFVALSAASSLALGLISIGDPLPADGAQFLILAQLVLWLYAGPALYEWLGRPRLRVAAAIGLLLAPINPLFYIAAKRRPEALAPPGSLDRRYQVLRPDAVAACLWLDAHAARGDRLVVPLEGDPEDLDGLKALYTGALAARPLLATRATFNLALPLARARGTDVLALYGTESREEAEAILDRWGVRFVWEEAARPLRFRSHRLRPAFAQGSVRLHEVERNSPAGGR